MHQAPPARPCQKPPPRQHLRKQSRPLATGGTRRVPKHRQTVKTGIRSYAVIPLARHRLPPSRSTDQQHTPAENSRFEIPSPNAPAIGTTTRRREGMEQ